MMRRLIAVGILAMAAVMAGGCEKKTEPVEPTEVQVTEENLDAEVDKMAEEIEADIAAEEE